MNKKLGYVDGKFNGNYLQWLWYEIKQGTNKPALAILFFGIGFQLALMLSHPITWVAVVTFIATIVGLLCTTLMMNGSPANGFMGAVSVIGFCIVNAVAGHWFSIVDQLIFFAAIDLPLIITWKTWGADFEKKVRTLNAKGWMVSIAGILAAWFVLYHVGILLKDTAPLTDSLVLAIGAAASILCFLKYNNTYTLWLAEDVVNVALWVVSLKTMGFNGASIAMLVSTLMYLATAIYGKFFSVWKQGKTNNQ